MLLLRQFILEWKLYSRDRVALFWTFAFPVLMLLGFGVIFRSGSTPAISLVWVKPAQEQPLDQALDTALSHTPLKITRLDHAAAEARWTKGESAAQLESLADGYRLRVNSYFIGQGQAAAQMVQQCFLMTQARAQGLEPQLIPISIESPGHTRATNYAAFLLPGLLGLNLLSMGLWSVGMVNVSYREKGKFRRLAVTPLPKWIFLLGQVMHRLTVSFVSSALVIAVGFWAFGIQNQGSYWELALALFLGTGCFMAMGFAMASFANTTEGYGAIGNIFFFPMMLLSGVYFTLDAAPLWMQKAVVALPLSPYLKALRAVFNDGASLAGHLPGLGIVVAWGLLSFLLAVKRFKWA